MKALLLTNEFPPYVYGGAGVHVEYLARELSKRIAVEVRCFGDQSIRSGHLAVSGHSFEEKRFPHTDAKLKRPLAALSRCVSFAATPTDADVVHCHTWYSFFGGVLAKLAYGLPLVVTTHSLEPRRPWKREQMGRGYDLSSWLEKTGLEMADAVVAVSEGMKADILRIFDVDPERVSVIYNGIDCEEYRSVEDTEPLGRFGIDPARPYVLFVGRITRQKGIFHLLNAVRHLPKELQAVLCAGAPDTGEIAREMEAAVARIRKERPDIVWIPEILDKPSLISLYSHAAVFCCPSIYEPFGLINVEAMACGTPVVASAVGGIPEIVTEGKTGFLVPIGDQDPVTFEPRDPDRFSRNLAGAILRVTEDPALGRRMGEAARQRAVDRFSWGAASEKLISLYGKLTETSRGL
jgi:alpha-maltose-1-phosphate synthase